MNDNDCDKESLLKTLKGRGFLDMYKLPEDDRIQLIGRMMTCQHCIKAKGELKTPLLLDDDQEKVARYISKLAQHFPGVRVLKQEKGPTPGCHTVWLGSPLPS
jgi:hypothetical protein